MWNSVDFVIVKELLNIFYLEMLLQKYCKKPSQFEKTYFVKILIT